MRPSRVSRALRELDIIVGGLLWLAMLMALLLLVVSFL
jgi:hypothetical protein